MGITAPLSILGFKSMQLSAVAVGKMIDTLNGIEIMMTSLIELKHRYCCSYSISNNGSWCGNRKDCSSENA